MDLLLSNVGRDASPFCKVLPFPQRDARWSSAVTLGGGSSRLYGVSLVSPGDAAFLPATVPKA
jgi:hypothetical protein